LTHLIKSSVLRIKLQNRSAASEVIRVIDDYGAAHNEDIALLGGYGAVKGRKWCLELKRNDCPLDRVGLSESS